MRILPLTGSHDRQGFDCGRRELNYWLQRIARQHQDKGLSRTFVVVTGDQPERIHGYYALALAEVDNRRGWPMRVRGPSRYRLPTTKPQRPLSPIEVIRLVNLDSRNARQSGHHPHISEPSEAPRITPARRPPDWDDGPGFLPDYDALVPPVPEFQ